MRNLKKFLALVLAMMMTLSLMVTANATNVEFGDGETITDAFFEDITVLAGMGVIKGVTTEEFQPTAPVTRAEMAAILYRIVTDDAEGTSDALHAEYGSFKDVASDKWYAGYVGYCANAGLIIGYGDGTFRPSNKVTGYEALVMVLRAMGYDQPGEFSKSDWRTHAASIATQRGLLTKINSTRYKGTLSQPALREVVAEIAFQAINVPMVEWTAAFGYQTTHYSADAETGEQRVENDTLGELYYGLTSATRIILGNQATGEGCTLLGESTKAYKDTNKQNHVLDISYAYPGSVIDAADAGEVAADGNIAVGDGIRLAEKTGLDMFGHKVTAWYNADDTGNKTTYAMFDRATHTATVQSLTAVPAADPNLSAADPADAFLGMAAQKAGFTVDLKNSKAWISDRYARIMGGAAGNGTSTFGTKPAAGKGSIKVAVAPTNANNSIYSLISNNDSKTVDVVIALQGEVGIVAQKDTTSTVQTVTVGDVTTNITAKASYQTDGKLDVKSLTEASTQTLGDKVMAWEIVGTNNAEKYGTYGTGANGNVGTYKNGNATTNHESFRYELEKLDTVVSGTVRTYGADKSITMTDGTVYNQSWFRVLPATQAADKVLGADNDAEPYIIPNPFQAGVTYTIALDKFGNWLGAVPAADKFIYGTFGDYGFGEVGSGTIGYTLTGVDWDGNKVINHPITSMFLNVGGNTPTMFINGSTVADNQLADGHSDDAYEVTKKFLGTTSGSEGNQIKAGKDTGYVVSEDGALTYVLTGYANEMAATTWVIDANDVKNGFADLDGTGVTLATPNTQFIVVTGTGTDTLDVDIYDGIADFLGNSQWVTINGDTGKKSHTYYLTEADVFNKWNTTNNKQLAKVIVDARDVKWSTMDNLYYAAPGTTAITGLSLAGNTDSDIKAYELWNNGEKNIYWVNGDVANDVPAGVGSPSAGEANANGVGLGTAGEGTGGNFYRLIQINTINGTPIYKAVKALDKASHTGKIDVAVVDILANGGVCNTNVRYKYFGTSNLSTAQICNLDGTVNSAEVYNVSNAKVVDLAWTPASTWTKIDSVASLHAAISGGYDKIDVSIVNDGVNVSVIYIVKVDKT